MTCLGMVVVYYGRGLSYLAAPWRWFRRATGKAGPAGGATAAGLLALLLLSGAATAALAGQGDVTAFDWSAWRALQCPGGGRAKPLDTLARETLRTDEQVELTDPGTREMLDPTAAYLALLLTGQAGKSRPAPTAWPPARAVRLARARPLPAQVVPLVPAKFLHTSRMPGTANPCCWSTRRHCARRWACRLTGHTFPFSTLAGQKSPIPRRPRRTCSSSGSAASRADKAPKRGSLEAKALDLAERYEAYRASVAATHSASCRCRGASRKIGSPSPALSRAIGTTRRTRPARSGVRRRS